MEENSARCRFRCRQRSLRIYKTTREVSICALTVCRFTIYKAIPHKERLTALSSVALCCAASLPHFWGNNANIVFAHLACIFFDIAFCAKRIMRAQIFLDRIIRLRRKTLRQPACVKFVQSDADTKSEGVRPSGAGRAAQKANALLI